MRRRTDRQHSIDEFGRIRMQGEEPVENLVTWVYEEGSYVPVAKIQNGERYTIISDYMGRLWKRTTAMVT